MEKIKDGVEGYKGVLDKVKNNEKIFSQLRDLRGDVLSLSNSIDLFIPEKMVTIEKEVETIFRLRELGLEKVAEELEGIDEEEDNRLKCLKARTALEQLVVDFCQKNQINHSSFFHNLDSACAKGFAEKAKQKAIAKHYSFVSKIVHKNIDANSKNTQFAVYGVFNIISSLIAEKENESNTSN